MIDWLLEDIIVSIQQIFILLPVRGGVEKAGTTKKGKNCKK